MGKQNTQNNIHIKEQVQTKLLLDHNMSSLLASHCYNSKENNRAKHTPFSTSTQHVSMLEVHENNCISIADETPIIHK